MAHIDFMMAHINFRVAHIDFMVAHIDFVVVHNDPGSQVHWLITTFTRSRGDCGAKYVVHGVGDVLQEF